MRSWSSATATQLAVPTDADLFEATLDDGALTDVQRRQVRRLPNGDRPDAHPNSTT
jgi:hypothetical protein